MSLLNLYENIAKTLKLEITDDGYLNVPDGDSAIPLTVNGVPFVMPTQEHINTALVPNETGKLDVVKHLWNPLGEDAIRGDSSTFTKMKIIMEYEFYYGIYCAGLLLLKVAYQQTAQKNTGVEINKFLASLSEANNHNIKQIVDDNTITKWETIILNNQDNVKNIISLFSKKGGTIDGNKYNRVATVHSPLVELLDKATKDNNEIYGVKLRPKDIIVFRKVLMAVLPEMNEDNTYTFSVGSNNGLAPGYASIMKMYIKVMSKIIGIATKLHSLDQEAADEVIHDIYITADDVENTAIYQGAVELIPSDLDITRHQANFKHQKPTSTAAAIGDSFVAQPQQIGDYNKKEVDPSIPNDPFASIVQPHVAHNYMPAVIPQQSYGMPYQQQVPVNNPFVSGYMPQPVAYPPMYQQQYPPVGGYPQTIGYQPQVNNPFVSGYTPQTMNGYPMGPNRGW